MSSLEEPEDLRAALDGDSVASEAWDRLPPSHRREYLDWIAEAKKVRTKRVADTLKRLKS